MHAVERGDRRAGLGALLDDGILRDLKAAAQGSAADARARVDVVGAGLEHIGRLVAGDAAVVVRGELRDFERDLHGLALAGLQLRGLLERAQAARRLAELALRRLGIDLDDLLARDVAGVFDDHDLLDGLAVRFKARDLHVERRVGQAETERVQHAVLRKRLEIAVADVDVLLVDDLLGVAEALARGVVRDVDRDRVAELAARGDRAGQDVEHAGAALLAALPDVQHRCGVVLFDPLHVDDVADVQQHRNALERAADRLEHLLLGLREQIAALGRAVVLILAGGAADDDDRDVGLCGGLGGKRCGNRHFLLAPRLLRPAHALFERVLRHPVAVDGLELFIDNDVRAVLQRVENTGHIPRIDRAAGARAALVIIKLDSAEHGNALALPNRQRLVVIFQKDAALCDGLPRQSGIAFKIKLIRIHFGIFPFCLFSGRPFRKAGGRRPGPPPRPARAFPIFYDNRFWLFWQERTEKKSV